MLTVQLVSTVLYLSVANFKVGVSHGLFGYNLEIRFSEFMGDYAIRNGHLKFFRISARRSQTTCSSKFHIAATIINCVKAVYFTNYYTVCLFVHFSSKWNAPCTIDQPLVSTVADKEESKIGN